MNSTQRQHEMKRLRFEEGKSLAEIGRIFDVSREYVRQMVGNTGKNFRGNWTQEAAQKLDVSTMTYDDAVNTGGTKKAWQRILSKVSHKLRGVPGTYQEWEYYAVDLLKQNGLDGKMQPTGHPFDILLDNGIRIDVKKAGAYNPPSFRSESSYRAANAKHGKDCDFFLVFIDKDDYFVIPSFEAKTHIIIAWPASSKPSKFHKYYRRIDLLGGAL